jgi:hypothetical protein
MAEAVNRRPLTAEFWVRTRASPSGICRRQNGFGTVFISSPSVSIVSTVLPGLVYHLEDEQ